MGEAEEVGGKSLDGLNRRVLQPLPPPPTALLHHQDLGHLAEHLTSPKVRPDQVEYPTACVASPQASAQHLSRLSLVPSRELL